MCHGSIFYRVSIGSKPRVPFDFKSFTSTSSNYKVMKERRRLGELTCPGIGGGFKTPWTTWPPPPAATFGAGCCCGGGGGGGWDEPNMLKKVPDSSLPRLLPAPPPPRKSGYWTGIVGNIILKLLIKRQSSTYFKEKCTEPYHGWVLMGRKKILLKFWSHTVKNELLYACNMSKLPVGSR